MQVSFRYLKRLELLTVPSEEPTLSGLVLNGKPEGARSAGLFHSGCASSTTAASSVACSTSGGGFGSYPSGCRNGANFKTYNECKESGVKRGWRHEDMAWYCSGLGLQ
jgi:hypothetical protein